jgi:DNA invertase Pin-like site-specific DNA recombinase
VSGARPEWRKLLKLLKAHTHGDVTTVTRIDQLARSTFDVFAIVKQIVDARWRRHGPTPPPAPGA